jgi:hypothetical protein
MTAVIRSAFLGTEAPLDEIDINTLVPYDRDVYKAILEGRYVLMQPHTHIMMPQVWESIVKPEGQINLTFLDPALNEREIARKQHETDEMYEKEMERRKEAQRFEDRMQVYRERRDRSWWAKVRDAL